MDNSQENQRKFALDISVIINSINLNRESNESPTSLASQVVKKYGLKIYHDFLYLLSNGNYREKRDEIFNFPTIEEINSRYAGIGKDYRGLLTKRHFDKILNFYKLVNENLPEDFNYRAEILEDIKASASFDIYDMISFYVSSISKDGNETIKIKALTSIDGKV